MSRILLVQHSKTNGATSFPIGLGQVAATLIEAGHDVDFLELAFEEDLAGVLRERIVAFDPEALGFTLWTTNYGEFRDLMKACPEASDLPVVAGGPHASADAEDVIRDGFVDVAVCGEGEVIAADLFEALLGEGDLSTVRGICRRGESGEPVMNDEAPLVTDLDGMVRPPYGMLGVDGYVGRLRGRPCVELMVSRGCPFKCSFCYRGPTGGEVTRRMSVGRVLEEVRLMKDTYGFRSFFFVDDTFTLNRKWSLEFCRALIDEGLDIAWACQTRIDSVDPELLGLMKRSGCVSIHFGVESGNQEIINHLIKDTSKEAVREAFRNCQKAGIPTIAYFLIGTPWETEETVRETVDFAKELKSTVTAFFAATPYKGSPMRQTYLDKGMPVPMTFEEYGKFWVEGIAGEDRSKIRRAGHLDSEALCLDATREIVRSQIRDVRSYPRLIREMVAQYGVVDFTRMAVMRLAV